VSRDLRLEESVSAVLARQVVRSIVKLGRINRRLSLLLILSRRQFRFAHHAAQVLFPSLSVLAFSALLYSSLSSTATGSPALSACDGAGSGVATRPSALQRRCAHHLRRVCCIPLSSCPPAPAPFFAVVGLGPQRRQQQDGSPPVKAAPLLPLNFRVAWLLFRTLLSSPSAMTVPTKDDSQR
jgi:hypothetical protein